MLILTRSIGQKILLSGGIEIMVVRLGPNTVRIGIEAPSGVNIWREEIGEESQDSQQRADGGTKCEQ